MTTPEMSSVAGERRRIGRADRRSSRSHWLGLGLGVAAAAGSLGLRRARRSEPEPWWSDPERVLDFLQEEPGPDHDAKPWHREFQQIIDEFALRSNRQPAILDWHTGYDLADTFSKVAIFSPPSEDPTLPYLDHSIDIVVIPFADPLFLDEARRVASAAIMILAVDEIPTRPRHWIKRDTASSATLAIEWLTKHNGVWPSASIIIPADNVTSTRVCLAALHATLPRAIPAEVIVIDDSSTETMWRFLARQAAQDDRMQIVRNPSCLGRRETWNRGATLAEGDILIFLDSHTIPLEGWFSALVATFQSHPRAGAVGGKVLFSDGRLQEAGGVIYSDGWFAQIGWGDLNHDAPLYNYVRVVDYCSDALLATQRSLFLEVGGFEAGYGLGSYADIDYCFEVWRKGYQVYYQPESPIIHFGDIADGSARGGPSNTHGRNLTINRMKFANKWAPMLLGQPVRPHQFGETTWHEIAIQVSSRHKDDLSSPGVSSGLGP